MRRVTFGSARRRRRQADRLALLLCLVLSGCRQQMTDQPYYRPLEWTAFFADEQSARHPPAGTVARGQLRIDPHLYGGKTQAVPPGAYTDRMAGPDGKSPVMPTIEQIQRIPYAAEFPFPVTLEVLQRGRERFLIYCAVCHGPLGYGDGPVVQRGFTEPPTYHSDRLRAAPVGYFYDVITEGLGSMPDYSTQIPPEDRWAIIAYLRALQLSQHAPLDELTEAARRETLRQLQERP